MSVFTILEVYLKIVALLNEFFFRVFEKKKEILLLVKKLAGFILRIFKKVVPLKLNKRKMKNGIVVLVMSLFSILTFGQRDNQRKALYNVEQSLAIQGYDPVAYFTDSKAVKGKKEYSTQYNGIVYYFASAKHKEMFLKKPNHYEPQYGGWCAYAMGLNGEKVSINPKTFKIIDGKLYLFYNAYFTNTLNDWNKNESKLKMNADTYWQKITQ